MNWDLEADPAAGGSSTPFSRLTRPKTQRRPFVPAADLLFPVINLEGVDIHGVTEAQAVEHILSQSEKGQGGVVVTPNLDHVRRCLKDVHFAALVSEADLVLADGMPVVWACKLQGTPLPGRVAGSDLISTLSLAAGKRGRSIFLLGGAPGTADAAAAVLKQREPNLKVVGTLCPDLGFEQNQADIARIRAILSEAKPDIIFVALGSPKQENLINLIRSCAPAAWWLGVGVSFSFLTGDVKRAPQWMRKTGLEWFHRLVQEPRRLFKRYVTVGIPFAGWLLARAAFNGVSVRLGRKPAVTQKSIINGHTLIPASPSSGTIEVTEPAALTAPTTPTVLTGNTESDASLQATPSGSTPTSLEGRSLHRLRGLILLGGTVRQTELTTSINRSVLDLPLDSNGSILNAWLQHAVELARICNIPSLPVRILVDRSSPEPLSASTQYYGTFRVERDQSEYRGTGGVLADLADDYKDDDLLIVANAQQVLLDPLAGIIGALEKTRGDVAIIGHVDGTPSGVMLLAAKTLRIIQSTGFVDMKEQALPLIASRFDVRVVHRKRPSGLPVRSLTDYIGGLRLHHRRLAGKPARMDPLAEDWQSSFSLVEEGAFLDPSARVHDSVILKGATIQPGAVVVRSLVCPRGTVKKDGRAVEKLVCPDDSQD